jgi:hypothetical protein
LPAPARLLLLLLTVHSVHGAVVAVDSGRQGERTP